MTSVEDGVDVFGPELVCLHSESSFAILFSAKVTIHSAHNFRISANIPSC